MTLCTECGQAQAVIEVEPRRFCPACAEKYIRGILAMSQEKAQMYGKERVRAERLAKDLAKITRNKSGVTMHMADCGHGVTYKTRIDAGGKSYCPDCAEKRIEALEQEIERMTPFCVDWKPILDEQDLPNDETTVMVTEHSGEVYSSWRESEWPGSDSWYWASECEKEDIIAWAEMPAGYKPA